MISNIDQVNLALKLLRDGLVPVCKKTWQKHYGEDWLNRVNQELHRPQHNPNPDDVAFLFNALKATWAQVFGQSLGPSVRSLVFEVADVRNRWAHQQALSSDDILRALDSMERILEAFDNAEERKQIRSLRENLMRQLYGEGSRPEDKPTEEMKDNPTKSARR
ncbi:Swt1 family HEPN domain-containing protein [Candidatus Poriferisocius sp.]|uniref:Swt1 family HEPN domain-containing protein n=1 Tax=Candidatus Poriferisocius sp. TaxID=3101276 RepID=UPI003B01C47D